MELVAAILEFAAANPWAWMTALAVVILCVLAWGVKLSAY